MRIDAIGLRSSCDASDTNWRCFCADVSSRSSIAFIVRASRPTSSSVSGSGTRRSIVAPVIDSASLRIASTGLSARPVKYHAASATSRIMSGTTISSTSVTESVVRFTVAVDCCATRVMRPVWVVDLSLRFFDVDCDREARRSTRPDVLPASRRTAAALRVECAALDLVLEVVELGLVRLLDPVDEVVVHEPHESEAAPG